MSQPAQLPLTSVQARLALWWAQNPDEQLTVKMVEHKAELPAAQINSALRAAIEGGWLQRRMAPAMEPSLTRPNEWVYELTPEARQLFEQPLAPHKDLQF